MASLALQNVSKSFAQAGSAPIQALREVSLDVVDGSFFVILGPSGSGKSTLLRIIAGLETADTGTIAIDGQVVNTIPPHLRDVAMVFQNYALHPHLTVRENLALGLHARGVAGAEIERRIESISRRLGLEGTLGRRPGLLSGGERQRVALGRALVRTPRVLLDRKSVV